ncbi:reticulon-2-like [Haliaeetus albicilla]|uniref:reticulon-2-like n=1 Tax=Haliaeetus albicilla TaxID=8969 RepID=UPI0037E94BBD
MGHPQDQPASSQCFPVPSVLPVPDECQFPVVPGAPRPSRSPHTGSGGNTLGPGGALLVAAGRGGEGPAGPGPRSRPTTPPTREATPLPSNGGGAVPAFLKGQRLRVGPTEEGRVASTPSALPAHPRPCPPGVPPSSPVRGTGGTGSPAPSPARCRPAPAAPALCPPPPRAPSWCCGDARRGWPGGNGAEGNREPHAGAAAMGQVLGFAHCKEAPSTASTTPDSTEGGNEESDFPELQAALEPPEEEEEDEDGAAGGGPPRELTFSYIAFRAGGEANEPGPRCRRDSRRGRPPRLSSGPPGGCSRGPDLRLAARAPPKRPEEPPAPPEEQLEVGGALPELGGPETEETPMSLAAAPAGPPPPAGGAPRPPPPAPPPDPLLIPELPPAPPDQSPSPLGADVLGERLIRASGHYGGQHSREPWRAKCEGTLGG